MNLIYESMTEKYCNEVIDIFNYYIENSFAAYFESKLPYQFFNKFLEITKGYPAYVLIDDKSKKVIGFCFLKAYSPLPVFKETAEITYFIEKSETGKGIGKKVLNLLQSEGKKIGIQHILASISSHNNQSLNFHKNNGFSECGRLHNVGKKNKKSFDVVWMEKSI
ncbi:N-acetyltransferase [Clostridium polyendosporum]|uniref:N-acetyltransferase n=1 Tax=Clostridium polyendosporum TaxID=69208 RepID=A0A919S2E4_9CLOT|nr:GNAT family N-acetyltransferase [Clostridium polyendosporum]GIM30101.1 N-acetyltransferase [Clostridium polyendosporum]